MRQELKGWGAALDEITRNSQDTDIQDLAKFCTLLLNEMEALSEKVAGLEERLASKRKVTRRGVKKSDMELFDEKELITRRRMREEELNREWFGTSWYFLG